MQKRQLGKTGLLVSPIGIGLAALGRPGYINLGHQADLESDYDVSAMEDRAHKVLDLAAESGVTYLDAARSYGKAEAFLSSWLKKASHGGLTIGSKWGYTYTANWQVDADAHEIKDHSLPVLEKQYAESNALLGSHLQIYQIHSATLESGVLENEEVLTKLFELKETGLRIGLSVSGPSQAEVIRRALDISLEGCLLFDTCQATWNLLEISAGEALEEAHRSGVGIIIKEGVANGRLTERNQSESFRAKKEVLDKIAAHSGVTLDAVALAAILAKPWVSTVLSGAATAEQLRSNLAAIDLDLSGADFSELAEESGEYWAKRSALKWN